jgi:hypothetical protein
VGDTCKGKAVPQHTYEGAGGEMRYNSYSLMTSCGIHVSFLFVIVVAFSRMNALLFHRRYHTMGRIPIVFSLPEHSEGSGGLFPKQFLEELNIQQIRYLYDYFTFNFS